MLRSTARTPPLFRNVWTRVYQPLAVMTKGSLAGFFGNGDWKRARELHLKLFPLSQAMFIETNPIPVKTSLAMLGKVKEEFRLPLCAMTEANRKKLETALRNYGLL